MTGLTIIRPLTWFIAWKQMKLFDDITDGFVVAFTIALIVLPVFVLIEMLNI
jgi:hypothetical protein